MADIPLSMRVVYLLRWHKPAGRLILMIPALWSLVLASPEIPPPDLTLVIILGSLATSAMGCVINDLWDRDIDREVERTKNRPLANKSLSVVVGIIVLAITAGCALGLASYLNPLSLGLCFAAVPVIVVYPLCKRFFALPQFVLSLAWGFAVLIPWTAVRQSLDYSCWLLWGATITWTMAFDTVYALNDREDDRRLGINSSALFFGDGVNVAVVSFYGLTTLLLLLLGQEMHLGVSYFYGVALATIGWGWHWYELKFRDSPPIYSQLFNQNVILGFILLLAMALAKS